MIDEKTEEYKTIDASARRGFLDQSLNQAELTDERQRLEIELALKYDAGKEINGDYEIKIYVLRDCHNDTEKVNVEVRQPRELLDSRMYWRDIHF